MGLLEGIPLSHGYTVTASHLPVRSARNGRHWRPSPPRRGGQPPSMREVPPKVAEGVIKEVDSFAGSEGVSWGGLVLSLIHI